MPDISVAIISYNQKKFLSLAVQSILTQSLQPDELVISDDGSTDGSQKIIKDFASEYDFIKPILHSENRGIVANLNAAFNAMQGDYVSTIAADDHWSDNKLKYEFKALQDSEYRWAYSRIAISNTAGEVKRWRCPRGPSGNIFRDLVFKDVSPRNWLMERSLYDEVGGYDNKLVRLEDWDLKLRLAHEAPAKFCKASTVYYRQHGNNYHTKGGLKPFREERRKVFFKLLWEQRDRFPKLDAFEEEARKWFWQHYHDQDMSEARSANTTLAQMIIGADDSWSKSK